MPAALEDVDFHLTSRKLLQRPGIRNDGQRLIRWPHGLPSAYSEKPERFRAFHEECSDTTLCDEVTYSCEDAQGDEPVLTLVRLGGPLLSHGESSPSGPLDRPPATQDRCDYYRALARDLWGEPTSQRLSGRLEVFEINSRVWGATLCMDGAGGELLIGQVPRIREIYDP
jgi:hypothetical protein